jgi:hypothetical protein
MEAAVAAVAAAAAVLGSCLGCSCASASTTGYAEPACVGGLAGVGGVGLGLLGKGGGAAASSAASGARLLLASSLSGCCCCCCCCWALLGEGLSCGCPRLSRLRLVGVGGVEAEARMELSRRCSIGKTLRTRASTCTWGSVATTGLPARQSCASCSQGCRPIRSSQCAMQLWDRSRRLRDRQALRPGRCSLQVGGREGRE